MHDHDECERLIHEALARGHDGRAEYLAVRCDRAHGQIEHHPETPDPTTAEPKEGAA